MEEEKVIITLILGTYCSSDANDQYPHSAVLRITEKYWERIQALSIIARDNDVEIHDSSIAPEWFSSRPPYTFDELGDKFIMNIHDYEYSDLGVTTDPDADENLDEFERTNGDKVVITGTGVSLECYGKWSGDVTSTNGVGIKHIKDTLNEEAPTPRERYYFKDGDEPIKLEDIPMYLNDGTDAEKLYCSEILKKGV